MCEKKKEKKTSPMPCCSRGPLLLPHSASLSSLSTSLSSFPSSASRMCSKVGACIVVVMDVVVETIKSQLARLATCLSEAWGNAATSKYLFRRTKSTWRIDHSDGVCGLDGFGAGSVTGLYITALVRRKQGLKGTPVRILNAIFICPYMIFQEFKSKLK